MSSVRTCGECRWFEPTMLNRTSCAILWTGFPLAYEEAGLAPRLLNTTADTDAQKCACWQGRGDAET